MPNELRRARVFYPPIGQHVDVEYMLIRTDGGDVLRKTIQRAATEDGTPFPMEHLTGIEQHLP